ncbi:hypothetical protein BDZ91DRAFT_844770 [Kalaharituber pfeilii]|nr:hypothetical protein BDZ91DRAFT_844770 [Kalaharituber pfeilii]
MSLPARWFRNQATIDHCKQISPGYSLILPITWRRRRTCQSKPIFLANECEIELVKDLFPDQLNYTFIYDSMGLFNSLTILAHAVHTMPEELRLVKKRDAKISHWGGCEAGNGCVGWVFGSVLEAGRQALLVSLLLAQRAKKEEREEKLKFEKDAKRQVKRLKLGDGETPYCATLGGAKVMGLEHKKDSFETGKE